MAKSWHKKAKHGFSEFTYGDGRDEALVDRDAENGDVLRVYTYHDASFLVPAGKKGTMKIAPEEAKLDVEKALRWRPGKNPLFVEASNPSVAYEYLVDNGFESGGGDNEDPWEGKVR